MLLHDQSHPIPTIPFAYSRELLTHEREIMEGGWSGDDDDDGDDLPSPEAKSASRLALPKKNRRWRRLRDENWEKNF